MKITSGSFYAEYNDTRSSRTGVQNATGTASLEGDDGKPCGRITVHVMVWPPEELTGRNARQKILALLNTEAERIENLEHRSPTTGNEAHDPADAEFLRAYSRPQRKTPRPDADETDEEMRERDRADRDQMQQNLDRFWHEDR